MTKNHLSTGLFTLATSAILLLAWLERHEYWYNAESGLGYAFGILGGTMMLLLLLYPARKYWKPMNKLFRVHHWFRLHMIFGVWGPCLILLHCNFRPGSLNSQIALYSMLLVAGSGLIGRFIYQKLHRGLYGEQIEFSQLHDDYRQSKEHFSLETQTRPLLSQEYQQALELIEAQLTRRKVSSFTAFRALRKIKRIHKFSHKKARQQLLALKDQPAALSTLITSTNHWHNGISKLQKMASYALYTRIFSLWHVLHLPFFIMMLLSSFVHIFVVHLY